MSTLSNQIIHPKITTNTHSLGAYANSAIRPYSLVARPPGHERKQMLWMPDSSGTTAEVRSAIDQTAARAPALGARTPRHRPQPHAPAQPCRHPDGVLLTGAHVVLTGDHVSSYAGALLPGAQPFCATGLRALLLCDGGYRRTCEGCRCVVSGTAR
jgi:hypothetical protein